MAWAPHGTGVGGCAPSMRGIAWAAEAEHAAASACSVLDRLLGSVAEAGPLRRQPQNLRGGASGRGGGRGWRGRARRGSAKSWPWHRFWVGGFTGASAREWVARMWVA